MSEDTAIGTLVARYAKHPGIRALLNLIPGWGSADVLLQARADEIKRQRLLTFFNSLAESHIPITEDLVGSDDFLHCFFKTTQAVVNTRRKEKIELFGMMLGATLDAQVFTGLDQYEELLDAFDSMSYREFGVLRALRDYETSFASKDFENDVARIQAYWPDFKENVCRNFELEEQEFEPFMERLQRTGFYTRNTGAMWDDDPRIGHTSRQFEKLCEFIHTQERSGNALRDRSGVTERSRRSKGPGSNNQ